MRKHEFCNINYNIIYVIKLALLTFGSNMLLRECGIQQINNLHFYYFKLEITTWEWFCYIYSHSLILFAVFFASFLLVSQFMSQYNLLKFTPAIEAVVKWCRCRTETRRTYFLFHGCSHQPIGDEMVIKQVQSALQLIHQSSETVVNQVESKLNCLLHGKIFLLH